MFVEAWVMDEETKRELQAVMGSLPEMKKEETAIAEMIAEYGINVLLRPDAYSILCSKLDWLANPSKYTTLPHRAANSEMYKAVLSGKQGRIEKVSRIYRNILNPNYMSEIVNANSKANDVREKALNNLACKAKNDLNLSDLDESNIIETFDNALQWNTNASLEKLAEIILSESAKEKQNSRTIDSPSNNKKEKDRKAVVI